MAVIQNACIFGFAGLTQPSQWQAANALYVTGNIGASLSSEGAKYCPNNSSEPSSGILPCRFPSDGTRSTQDD